MYHLDLTLPTLNENLALDEALLLAAEGGGPEVLRLWEWPSPAVVLGAASRLADDVDVERCRADGVPIHRRASGGGTVLLGPGCLLFSVVLSFDRAPELAEVRPSYGWILGRICAALAPLAPELEPAGLSDLAIHGRKVSGNAQQRKRRHLLHHGTLLYAFNAGRVERYLRPPARQPEYRAGRKHAAFMDNLPVPGALLRQVLREAWQADPAAAHPDLAAVAQLVSDKYQKREWVHRR